MPAKLLNPKVVVRLFEGITFTQLKRLLATRRQKKYGFKDVAYEVEELDNKLYNVRMEYIA